MLQYTTNDLNKYIVMQKRCLTQYIDFSNKIYIRSILITMNVRLHVCQIYLELQNSSFVLYWDKGNINPIKYCYILPTLFIYFLFI